MPNQALRSLIGRTITDVTWRAREPDDYVNDDYPLEIHLDNGTSIVIDVMPVQSLGRMDIRIRDTDPLNTIIRRER